MEGSSGTHLTDIDNMCMLFTRYLNYGFNMHISCQSFIISPEAHLCSLVPNHLSWEVVVKCYISFLNYFVPCWAIHPADTAIKSPMRTNTVNVGLSPTLCKRPHLLLPHQKVCSRHPP